ncbi:MAG: hypothetical protein U0939_09365 [Pirellulales bacterium]
MTTIAHEIRLIAGERYAGHWPVEHLGKFMAELPPALRSCVSMAFSHRGKSIGRRPGWLERAADVRWNSRRQTQPDTLILELPPLGECAAELYRQQTLDSEFDDRPAKDDTALDLLGDVLSDVALKNADSDRFDHDLLGRIAKFGSVFKNGPFQELLVTSRRFPSDRPFRLTSGTAVCAKELLGRTPVPQRVRLVGELDGIVASTQRFSLLLDTGEHAMGVFAVENSEALRSLWQKRVVVCGMAIYRPSGRLLRVDAESIEAGDGESSLFSRLPSPPIATLDHQTLRQTQGPRSGVNALIGNWPGDETDEEIEALLERFS